MASAVEWETDHALDIRDIKAAIKNKDPYLAVEILNRIAPAMDEHEHAIEPETAGDDPQKTVLELKNPASGQLHSTEGPALVKGDGTRFWYFNGMLHNPQGPAVIKANGELQYYYLGTKCKTAEELDDTVRRAQERAQKAKALAGTTDSGT